MMMFLPACACLVQHHYKEKGEGEHLTNVREGCWLYHPWFSPSEMEIADVKSFLRSIGFWTCR